MTTIPDSVIPAEPLPPQRRFNRQRSAGVIITILVLVEVISAFETSMVYAAIPTIIADFNSDAATVGWAVTAFLLVAAASAAVCGRLGDMYGRERVLVVILAAATVGSLISALGDSITAIIVGRAIQGVAGAILPLCLGLARQHLSKEKVPFAVAVIAGSAVAAGAASAYVAGLMIDHASWHMIFIVAAIYAVFTLLLVLFVLPWRPPVGTTQKVDYIGTIVFAPAIAAILLGVNKSSTWGWSDPKTLGVIIAGSIALVLWVGWELRVSDPIANVRLFTDRKVALTMVATLSLAIGPMAVGSMVTPLVLQSPETAPYGLGMSPTDAGLLALLAALIGFAFTPVSGRLTRTMGSRASLIVGSVLFIVVAVLLVTAHDSAGGMFAMVTAASVATAFAYTALPNLIVEAVPVENTSEATGLQTVLRTGGQGVGTSVATTVLAASAVGGSALPAVAGLNAIAGMICIGAVITVGLALLLRPGSVYTNTN